MDRTNSAGIWSEGSDSLSLVVRAGDAAPGTEPGVVFSHFDTHSALPVVFNDAGQIAFSGSLTGRA